MSIDTRGRQAASDLLEQAAQRPVPRPEELVAPRRSRAPMMLAGAAAVLAVVALAFTITSRDDVTPAMPGGGKAVEWAPRGLGVTMQVPASWKERGSASGFTYVIGSVSGDPYV